MSEAITVRVDALKGANLDKPFKQLEKAAGTAQDVVRAFASDMHKATKDVQADWESLRRSDFGKGGLSAGSKNQFFGGGPAAQAKKAAEGGGKNPITEFNSALGIASQALQMFGKVAGIAAAASRGGITGAFDKIDELTFGDARHSLYLDFQRSRGGMGEYEHGSPQQKAAAKRSAEEMQKDAPFVQQQAARRAMQAQFGAARGTLDDQLALSRTGGKEEIARFQNINAGRDQARNLSQQIGGLGQLEMVRQQVREVGMGDPQQADAAFRASRERERARAEVANAQRGVNFYQNEKGLDPGVKAQRVAAAQNDVVAAQKNLLAAEQKQLDLIKQQSDTRLAGLRSAKDAAQAIIDAEKSKLGGMQEQFGRLDENQRDVVRDLAGRLGRGEKLDQDEIDAARQFGFFDEKLQKIDRDAGAAAGFDDIKKLLGLDNRLKEAEKTRVEIDNKIVLEIKGQNDALAKQIADAVMPALVKMQKELEAKLANDRKLAEIANRANGQG